MSRTASTTGDQLTNALRALDVNFILGGKSKDASLHKQPARLIAALKEPFFLLRSAETMKRLRVLCETQAPEPMRRRHLYAPPNFLEFA